MSSVEDIIKDTIDDVTDAIIELVEIASENVKSFVRLPSKVSEANAGTKDFITNLQDRAKDFATDGRSKQITDVLEFWKNLDSVVKQSSPPIKNPTTENESPTDTIPEPPFGLSVDEALEEILILRDERYDDLGVYDRWVLRALTGWKKAAGL